MSFKLWFILPIIYMYNSDENICWKLWQNYASKCVSSWAQHVLCWHTEGALRIMRPGFRFVFVFASVFCICAMSNPEHNVFCVHTHGGALSRWDPPHTWYWPAGLLWKEANTYTATALIVIKTPSLWSSGKNVLVKWRLNLKKFYFGHNFFLIFNFFIWKE